MRCDIHSCGVGMEEEETRAAIPRQLASTSASKPAGLLVGAFASCPGQLSAQIVKQKKEERTKFDTLYEFCCHGQGFVAFWQKQKINLPSPACEQLLSLIWAWNVRWTKNRIEGKYEQAKNQSPPRSRYFAYCLSCLFVVAKWRARVCIRHQKYDNNPLGTHDLSRQNTSFNMTALLVCAQPAQVVYSTTSKRWFRSPAHPLVAKQPAFVPCLCPRATPVSVSHHSVSVSHHAHLRLTPLHTLPPTLSRTNTANQTQGIATPTTTTTSTMPVVPHNPNGVANLISSKDMAELTKGQHEGTQHQQQEKANNTNTKIPPKHYDSAGVHSQHQQLQQPRSNKQS